MNNYKITGVYSAAATPLNADGSPDLAIFTEHCQRLIEEGCHGVALLGTTGEANSFSLTERRTILEAALEAGISADKLLPGTGVVAIPETVELTKHALSLGVSRVVMLPPSYYKGVSDEGLFAAYAQILEKIGDSRLQVILYHIPQVSGVPLSISLISRLVEAFPETVVGIKDSAGDFNNMQAIVAACPGFSVLCGADPLLLPLLKAGGAGCVTATSNLVADSLRTVYDNVHDATRSVEVETAQARINAFRTLSNSYVQIPTIKAMIGLKTGNVGWRRTRPPLVPLNDAEYAALADGYAKLP
ncbi:dihydrodipicolinate synthase family protein [Rhizobium bangladeshense]|uniref:dihydrodipicolinate synthase family protein n=1 Tax=Rhizobium bangladeshense TaxID=1138189 RepID=UPI001A9975D1|nr:dihydrodipicolinate synthase family protein [Rhizobium bangladeshense]MBX4905271.1 dihydrodipicolinate synthase family protein [Rhizobium bangladeshense]MBX4917101.1 dihydrodipicolinate synthase family protein [Rhizobium bangladeshense]MBX4923485.1 dihydrodipicolinate synthase family protein [Rhizobium bangladeshense]MBY3615665.1 dihydrodipicolinate synthase family protein [Rhizobium bangladeshense]QSY98456.1 dihydrodipicolinate synthase family protein [Rhizobium bangladeshense]